MPAPPSSESFTDNGSRSVEALISDYGQDGKVKAPTESLTDFMERMSNKHKELDPPPYSKAVEIPAIPPAKSTEVKHGSRPPSPFAGNESVLSAQSRLIEKFESVGTNDAQSIRVEKLTPSGPVPNNASQRGAKISVDAKPSGASNKAMVSPNISEIMARFETENTSKVGKPSSPPNRVADSHERFQTRTVNDLLSDFRPDAMLRTLLDISPLRQNAAATLLSKQGRWTLGRWKDTVLVWGMYRWKSSVTVCRSKVKVGEYRKKMGEFSLKVKQKEAELQELELEMRDKQKQQQVRITFLYSVILILISMLPFLTTHLSYR